MPNIARAAINVGSAGLRRADKQWRTVAREVQRLVKKARRQQEWITRAPQLARVRAQQGRAAVVRAARRIERLEAHVLQPYRVEQRVMRALAQSADGRGPIIAGPWTSEVGYEALYWVPFLRWAADRFGVRPDRIVAVSRGGTDGWYRDVASRYVDIFDLVDPAEFGRQAALRRERGDQKQMGGSDFDADLVARASARLGIRDAAVWHPGLMYQMFRAFWHGDRSLDFLQRHAAFQRLSLDGSVGPGLNLPPDYAAVKCYTGPALPDTPDNRARLHDFVGRLAARMPVVMLDTAWTVDEHTDYAFDGIPNVTTLRPSLDPRTNLDVQTRVIAGARVFMGTCGGLAWLAPLLGVETLAVYDDDRYLAAHLYAARHAYRRTKAARFSTVNIRALQSLAGDPARIN